MFTDGGASKSRRRPIGDWFDAAFVGTAMLTSLLPIVLGTFTGVLFIALPALFCYYRFERVGAIAQRCWPLLAIGVWAVISALWSPYPGSTVYYGLQLGLTIMVACLIGAGTRPRQALYGLFACMFIHGLAVLIYGLVNDRYHPFDSGYPPFIGLAGSKNTTADMGSLGFMCALAMLLHGIRTVRPVAVILALALVAIDLGTIIAAQSAGANAAVALATVFFLGWWLTSVWPVPGRVAVMAMAGIAGIAAAASRSVWYPLLFESYLQFAGKDENLTGRAFIWSRAEVLIHQFPWFGRGYASFWIEGGLEPNAIWDTMLVEEHSGFNFHSSVYEVLVYFGRVGLIAIAAVFLVYILLLARRLVLEPRPVTILFAALIAYDGLRFSFESLPLGIFAHSTLFLYGALSHGVGLEFNRRRAGQATSWASPSKPLRQRLIRTGI